VASWPENVLNCCRSFLEAVVSRWPSFRPGLAGLRRSAHKKWRELITEQLTWRIRSAESSSFYKMLPEWPQY